MISVEVPALERKLVAILAADVEGYSRLMHLHEEKTLATLSNHRGIIDTLIADGRGQIAGSAGDSILAEFVSVVDALRCAVAIQQELHRENNTLEPDSQMQFRIGINVGDVMVKHGSIFGDGVNVASRLEQIAEAGGICVTRGVRDHVRDRSDYQFEDLGEQTVKNIARPVRVFKVIFDPGGSTTVASPSTNGSAPQAGLSMALEPEASELLFWESVKDSEDSDEYSAYLSKYPDGAFALIARSRLSNPKPTEQDLQNGEIELTFWRSVEDSSSEAMYEAYLAKYPDGNFRELAEIWLAAQK